MFPSSTAGSGWGDSPLPEMRYLNMSRILELAQQGKIYLCQAIPGFSNLLLIIASERKFIFLSVGFFLFVWVFFPLILHFSPFPTLSCLFPPLLLFLELPVFPRHL